MLSDEPTLGRDALPLAVQRSQQFVIRGGKSGHAVFLKLARHRIEVYPQFSQLRDISFGLIDPFLQGLACAAVATTTRRNNNSSSKTALTRTTSA